MANVLKRMTPARTLCAHGSHCMTSCWLPSKLEQTHTENMYRKMQYLPRLQIDPRKESDNLVCAKPPNRLRINESTDPSISHAYTLTCKLALVCSEKCHLHSPWQLCVSLRSSPSFSWGHQSWRLHHQLPCARVLWQVHPALPWQCDPLHGIVPAISL